MKVKFNTITWYSKLLSYIFIFGIFPIIIFKIGVSYNQTVEVMSFAYASTPNMFQNGTYDDKSFQGADSYAARKSIQGEWVSSDDDKYTMNIKEDGLYNEEYSGEMANTGSWLIRDNLAGTKYANLPAGLYLQEQPDMAEKTTGSDTMYYKVMLLNAGNLDLKYLDSEKMLSFTKGHTKSQ